MQYQMVCIFRTADPDAVDWTDELIGSFQDHLDTTDNVKEHCAMSNLGMKTFGDVGVSIILLQLCKINIWNCIKRKCGHGVKQQQQQQKKGQRNKKINGWIDVN